MSLADTLQRMSDLADVTEGRVDDELTARTRRVLQRADERLAMGAQTVIALAGPTGAGKSSLTNALAGVEIANPGVRRPMTSETLAISFGPTNTALLDWLGIERRHEVPEGQLDDVVLLDLPDHDSVRVSHRAEVERLVKVVDQFVWVTDPQKYADASIHQRYLRPLAEHRDVITVVLNQADRLSPADLEQCLKHLSTLLEQDGLGGVTVLPVSAKTGDGVSRLRLKLGAIAATKTAAADRLEADMSLLSEDFARALGESKPAGVSKQAIARLEEGMAQAAGVPLVERAVKQGMVHRGALATGWPVVNWWRRFRPDPLKRLRIEGPRQEEAPSIAPQSSLPQRGPVAQAQLGTALRQIADEASAGLPAQWRDAVHAAAHSSADTLPDTLDRAIVEADLGTQRIPVWWRLLRFLQWLLIAAVIVGLGWLTINFILTYLGLPELPRVAVGGEDSLQVPLPTLLLGGGLILGFVLSVVAGLFVNLGAKAAARRARRVLRREVAEIAAADVVAPLEAELDRYQRARKILRKL